MALIDYHTMIPKVGISSSLEALVEAYADRVPATTETMAQLDLVTRTFYSKRIQHRVAPPLTELAARCIRNEGLRHGLELKAAMAGTRTKRAQSVPVVSRDVSNGGRPALRYRSCAEVTDKGLLVYAGLVQGLEVQTSAVGVA